MIFERVDKWMSANLPEKLHKPLFGCPVCMTPWWGTIIYLLLHYLNLKEFGDIRAQVIIVTVFTAAGISTIILMLNKIYDVMIKEDKLLKKEMKEENIK